MKKIFVLTAGVALAAIFSCARGTKAILAEKSDYTQTSLDEGWEFRQVGTDKWMPATVPGVVHTDLFDNKVIEDPLKSINEKDIQWIENEDWQYRKTFTPSKEQLKAEEVYIDFKGLDTYADVRLNDSLILAADNMFVEWRVPVKKYLKDGENKLDILFRSSYKMSVELSKSYPKLPGDNDKAPSGRATIMFIRKAQYHFGWDWGPRFATSGIWKPVYLESYNIARIDNVQYIQKSQSDSLATFEANVTVDAAKNSPADIILCNDNGEEYASKKVSLKKGVQTVNLSFSIKNPKLWWPNGMGEDKPTLYPLTAAVIVDGKKADANIQKVGVRTVKLVRKADEFGEAFYFEVNGKPLFMKGANYIPQEVFLPRVTADRYKKMVDVAAESNMNMLRVWGGGIYESDDFYNYCDEAGILVWQDFPFACAFYPWDEKFYNSVKLEASQNIKRLRNHPSLAVWCGNNEIDEAWHKWGYKEDKKNYPWTPEEETAIRKGIDDLFFTTVLPGVLAVEDTTRSYHPSSPVYGWGDPRSQVAGDVHYWGVFHGEEPFTAYKDKPGRFSNEYGHQSFANYDTWKKAFKPEDMVLGSESFLIHQKNPKGYRVIEEYMAREVPVVKDDLRTYIYLSQLVQADGIRIAMEGHRRNRPFTMGSLYWQINDCWPVTSWSSMDYPYGYKALQFFAKNSFAPTIVTFNRNDKNKMIELWSATDELKAKKGTVKLTLVDLDGKKLWDKSVDVNMDENSSKKLFEMAETEILGKNSAKDVVLVAEGDIDGAKVRSLYYFLPYKDMNWRKSNFDVSYTKDGDKVVAKIKAKNLLKAVLFESEYTQGNPTDAYFDMLPGEEREIELVFDEDKSVNDLNISVRTLNDVILKARQK